uniref:WD repeat-containing protein 44 n=1 Tax=Amblyomma triste TaxID=251400 RepID=A0A023GC56_AMBTT
MASDSDSDEFFDAVSSPIRSVENKDVAEQDGKRSSQAEMEKAVEEASRKAQEAERRQQQIEEMRRRMLYEDEEPGFSSEQSSAEGLYLQQHDRGPVEDLRGAEPDLVASTKEGPQPPPRRRRGQAPSTSGSGDATPRGLPRSPAPSIAEFSMDLPSACRGQYVVKPQDDERDRGNPRSPESRSEGSLRQLNIMMRTRSDSGRPLTDREILDQVEVLNLDTGEKVPLSVAEERLPQCLNPLALHIMRITSEYVSQSDVGRASDEESTRPLGESTDSLRRKAGRLTRMLGRKVGQKVGQTVTRIKSAADERLRPSEEEGSEEETLKVKTSHRNPPELDSVRLVQEIASEHTGAVWTMKFSACGRLLATAGQDTILRIWVLRSAYQHFDDMRNKYRQEAGKSENPEAAGSPQEEEEEEEEGPFRSFCKYSGHTADLLDVSWSRNNFILSSSMDKTVRLWHISSRNCLCCFQHVDFVTAIAFHPRDDRYFLSGSLDGKLRLWNIPDKKVALWNELDGQTKLITAANFCQKGKFAVVGSYDGRCVFYNTEQLKYYTQIHVRSTRGKNAQGRKITGIEPMPGEDKILVTSNDSRIRLYDLRDLSLSCKYKGYVNLSSQIKGSFSHDGRYVISGSENQFIYIWKTYHDYKFSSARRDRNTYWESIKAHNAVVTAAVFAPKPDLVLQQVDETPAPESPSTGNYVIISADFSGTIKVFALRSRSRASLH